MPAGSLGAARCPIGLGTGEAEEHIAHGAVVTLSDCRDRYRTNDQDARTMEARSVRRPVDGASLTTLLAVADRLDVMAYGSRMKRPYIFVIIGRSPVVRCLVPRASAPGEIAARFPCLAVKGDVGAGRSLLRPIQKKLSAGAIAAKLDRRHTGVRYQETKRRIVKRL